MAKTQGKPQTINTILLIALLTLTVLSFIRGMQANTQLSDYQMRGSDLSYNPSLCAMQSDGTVSYLPSDIDCSYDASQKYDEWQQHGIDLENQANSALRISGLLGVVLMGGLIARKVQSKKNGFMGSEDLVDS